MKIKNTIATLLITAGTLASSQAYTVIVDAFQNPATPFVDNVLAPFNGFITFGTFQTAPNFGTDTQAALWTNFLPWQPDLAVSQSGVEDFSSATATPVINGLFPDVTGGASASIGNNNALTSYYNQYAGKTVFAWVGNTATQDVSTQWSIFRTSYSWEPTLNVAGGLSTGVFVGGEPGDGTTLSRFNGVTLLAVPEPTTGLLAFMGLAGFAGIARRRK